MFIKTDTIQNLINKYGQPELRSFRFKVSPDEFEIIKGSQKNGRKHDVTLYTLKDDKIIVIAKHFYPAGMFRAPSGGINLGEDFEQGAKREALEETGCEIMLKHFLLMNNVTFYMQDKPDKQIEWVSYIFQADYLSGDFQFTDKHEIREVHLATLKEFENYSKTMRSTNIGGLHYRAALHDEVKKLLKF